MYLQGICSKRTFALFLTLIILSPGLVTAQTTERSNIDRTPRVSRDISRANEQTRFLTEEIIVKYTGEPRAKRLPTRGRDVNELLTELQADPTVEYAEPNYIAYAFAVPNDPYYKLYQWNFDNDTYGGVHAEAAWDITSGNAKIVAVIDTGVAYENYNPLGPANFAVAPDLANTSFVPGYDFVNNDTHPNDDQGHGTHVAGTIAGSTNDNSGVAGLAYGASIMPIKVLDSQGSGSYADVAEGIRFAADNGADVINLSLGGPVKASYLEEAIQYAYNKGVTIVAAAGNDNGQPVSYPAAYNDYVIAVGATGYDETLAPYSNKGTALDIVAPGGDTTVDRNGDGYGDGILQQTLAGSPTSFGYYFYQGTSMAAPHVAAAAAMVLASGKAKTPIEVRELLQSTADDLGPAGLDTTYGHGLLNLAAALASDPVITPPEPNPEPEPETEPEPIPNQAPTADAGSDQTLSDTDNNGSERVTLSGNSSTDTDGVIVSYQWYEADTLLGSDSSISPTLTVGTHDIDLIVTDNDGASSTDSVRITVEAATPEPEPEPTPAILFSDSFESGLSVWTQDAQIDWNESRRNAFSGSYAAEIDGRATDSLLISPLIATNGRTVKIDFAWLIENSFDTGEYIAFDISTDGGTTWTTRATLRGNVDTEDRWHALSATVETSTSIRIRFRGKVSGATEDGYVDAVTITSL